MFIGMQIFIQTFLAEMLVVVLTAGLGYWFAFGMGYQFLGLLVGMFSGQILGLVVYSAYFHWSSNFTKWHQQCDEARRKKYEEG